ncbi:MAG: 16S rRNA (guanine(966)-N(2))-methyltransferase RsmD [Bacteroidales bacterium]|jgi:16S rRNA (guanine(966)-N(2))-methyltransferase RsmD|nr:16S rRNA (guanine(966)-N(2))-methyltransferase RsmD [Bacteroidales bacterium]
MRIIGGQYKGKQIAGDAKLLLRPTTDFAKEGLFNILSGRYDWEGLEALDLFAGTGSISYEFVSRGADSVHAVEMDPHHVAFIRATAGKLNMHNLKIVRDEAFHFLSICKATYNLIFADPPYEMAKISAIPDEVLSRNLLKPEGMLIVEHSKHTDFSQHQRLVFQRNYGNVHFSFFQ